MCTKVVYDFKAPIRKRRVDDRTEDYDFELSHGKSYTNNAKKRDQHGLDDLVRTRCLVTVRSSHVSTIARVQMTFAI